MKKWILIFLTAVTFAILGLSAGEASTSVDSPFPLQSPDRSLTLTITDLGNGVDHGVVFFNNAANTAIAAVLNTSGNPDNSLLGSAFLAADFNSAQPLWTSSETAAAVVSPYPAQSPDMIQLLPADQLNSFNHAVIFINSAAGTAMAVVLDPTGVPDNFLLGYAFLAADLKTDPAFVWGSQNGLAWYCISGCK